jgi:CCR4-NOT transcription complex subunit 1
LFFSFPFRQLSLNIAFQRKYNIPVTVTILQARLITVEQQDQSLAKLVAENPRPPLLDFAVGVIRACLTHEPPVATRVQFRYLVEILLQVSNAGKATEEYVVIRMNMECEFKLTI